MNKRLFKSLLYREYYVARKFYISNLIGYFMFVIVSLLALLSYRWGNLHLYSHLMSDTIKAGLDNVIKFAPVFIATVFWGGALDTIPNDEKVSWARFRMACPAKPFPLALAKYSCLFLSCLVSLCMVFGWLGLHSLLTGTAITRGDLKIILATYGILTFFYVTLTTLTIWLKKSEFAAFVFLGVLYPSMIIISLIDPSFTKAKALGIRLIEFIPLIIPVLFGLGLFCTTILYGRREK